MAVVEVPCPGCGAILKAPDSMAGKRAKCKKCETRFVVPGSSQSGDTAGDSQMLSALEMPTAPASSPAAAAAAFDFGAMLDAPPEPKKSATVPKPEPRTEPKPSRAPALPPPPAASGDFDFFAAGAASPEPPTPKPIESPKAKSIPKAPTLPPEAPKAKSLPKAPPVLPKPTVKPAPAAAVPDSSAGGGFDFGAMLDEPPAPKTPAGRMPAAPSSDDDEEVPQAESVQEGLSLDDDPAEESDDPFGFPGGAAAADTGPPSSSSRGKPKGKEAKTAKSTETRRGYRQQSGGGGKMKLILAGVGVLLLGGAIAGGVVFMNKKKGEQAQAGKGEDKDKSGEGAAPPDGAKNDPTPPDAKGTTPTKKDTTKKDPTKKDTSGKTVNPMTGGAGTLPDRPTLVLPNTVRTLNLQVARPKPEVFVEPNGAALTIDAEFTKVRRLMAPTRSDMDIGILWEREGVPNTPGNKLVMDVCRPSGTRQTQIEFTGDGKPVPAADLSEDGRWFAHGDGSKVTVWKVEDKSKLVDAWDVYAALPAQQKAGLAAVYFPTMPKDKKDAPPEHLVTVATDGAVHLWNIADKTQLGGYVSPRGRPGRVVEGRSVVLSQLRGFVVVAVGGTVFKATVDGGGVNASVLAELGADVPISLGVATYGETTVYAFETGTDKKERAVMLIKGSTSRTWRWPDTLGMPVAVGWVSNDLIAVSSNQGAAVLFDHDDEKNTFLPKYAVVPPDKMAMHATTDVCHWYLIPNATNPGKCHLVQVSPPAGGGLLDEPNKGTSVPLGRLDVRGFSK